MDEGQLIGRALRGDPAAERALYDAHVDRVYRLAYRMTGDSHLAEDCTQDTFLRAFDRLSAFRGEAAFATWLHSVAVSVILNSLRKRKRRQDRETGVESLEPFDTGTVPHRPDLRLRVQGAIEALSEILRLVFVMHELEGFKHGEIAKILEIPEGTSRARLNRAKEQLREMLAGANATIEEQWT